MQKTFYNASILACAAVLSILITFVICSKKEQDGIAGVLFMPLITDQSGEESSGKHYMAQGISIISSITAGSDLHRLAFATYSDAEIRGFLPMTRIPVLTMLLFRSPDGSLLSESKRIQFTLFPYGEYTVVDDPYVGGIHLLSIDPVDSALVREKIAEQIAASDFFSKIGSLVREHSGLLSYIDNEKYDFGDPEAVRAMFTGEIKLQLRAPDY